MKPNPIDSVIAIFVGILCGALIGIVMGMKIELLLHKCPEPKKHAIGYSVIGSDKILTCCSEVKTYQWNKQSK